MAYPLLARTASKRFLTSVKLSGCIRAGFKTPNLREANTAIDPTISSRVTKPPKCGRRMWQFFRVEFPGHWQVNPSIIQSRRNEVGVKKWTIECSITAKASRKLRILNPARIRRDNYTLVASCMSGQASLASV